MERLRFFTMPLVLAVAATANAQTVMYLLGSEAAPSEGNEAVFEILDARGFEIELWDNVLLREDLEAALDAADSADVVFVDESINSSRADAIIDTTTPVIITEQYAFDNWAMTGGIVGHGSPTRPNGDGIALDAGSAFGTAIDIVDASHPIARGAGLLAGEVEIYDEVGGRIDWGRPSDEADIVAQLPGFEPFQPASPIFVYEAGDRLVNGSTAVAMRIGFFLSDTNRGPEPEDPDVVDDGTDGIWEGNEATLLTEAGIALLNSALDYALGLSVSEPGDFNGDGVLDLADINLLTVESALRQNNPDYDLDADAAVDVHDITVWAKDLRNTWMGDANLDGEFNSGDFVDVFTAGKFEQDIDANWSEGDWNGDGRFDSGDFVVAFTDGGFEQGLRPAAVPEPAAGLLFSVSLLLLSRWQNALRRRRR